MKIEHKEIGSIGELLLDSGKWLQVVQELDDKKENLIITIKINKEYKEPKTTLVDVFFDVPIQNPR